MQLGCSLFLVASTHLTVRVNHLSHRIFQLMGQFIGADLFYYSFSTDSEALSGGPHAVLLKKGELPKKVQLQRIHSFVYLSFGSC